VVDYLVVAAGIAVLMGDIQPVAADETHSKHDCLPCLRTLWRRGARRHRSRVSKRNRQTNSPMRWLPSRPLTIAGDRRSARRLGGCCGPWREFGRHLRTVLGRGVAAGSGRFGRCFGYFPCFGNGASPNDFAALEAVAAASRAVAVPACAFLFRVPIANSAAVRAPLATDLSSVAAALGDIGRLALAHCASPHGGDARRSAMPK